MSTGADSASTRVVLDEPVSYAFLDNRGMFGFAKNFPRQLREAAEVGHAFVPPRSFRNPKLVLLSGLGGSAVAGDFLARLCEDRIGVPIVVNRSYQIPHYVGKDTLFIASSHSGNTEETLAATSAALRRKAKILCITTNGKLRDFARRHGPPQVALLEIPQTDPPMPPRAALAYSLIPLVRALETLGLYPGAGRHIAESISLIGHLRDRIEPDVPTQHNQAKQLAQSLRGTIPWVHGTVGIMAAAAYRWRTQFNENSKMLAYSSEYPELNHNEVIGWEQAQRIGADIGVVTLRSSHDHWRVRARVDITKKKFIKPTASSHLIDAEGHSPLAQLLWTVYLGDFTSLYLAMLNGVDPGSIDSIDTLKADLEKLQRPKK